MENENTDDSTAIAAPTQPMANQIMRQDFGGMSLATENQATAALVAAARANIEARWLIAMKRPRNADLVRHNVILECRRPGFADAAVYHRPVGGGKVAIGLSIRFAEVAARHMGNIGIDIRQIYEDTRTRVVRVSACDYESNVEWPMEITIDKTVERRDLKRGQKPLGERTNSYGDRVFIVEANEGEIATKQAAMISKAVRGCILRLVPGDLQDEALSLCQRIAADKDAKDPNEAKRKILDAFATINVSPADLEAWLGGPIAKISPVQIGELRGLYKSIADGDTTWSEVADNIAERQAQRARVPKAAPAPAQPPAASAPTTQATAPTVTIEEQAAAQRAIDKIASEAKPAEPARDPLRDEGKPKRGTAALKAAIAPTTQAPLVLVPDEIKERPCAGCGVPIDALPGGKCEACRNE